MFSISLRFLRYTFKHKHTRTHARTPTQGIVFDRRGPVLVTAVGAVLAVLGWVMMYLLAAGMRFVCVCVCALCHNVFADTFGL